MPGDRGHRLAADAAVAGDGQHVVIDGTGAAAVAALGLGGGTSKYSAGCANTLRLSGRVDAVLVPDSADDYHCHECRFTVLHNHVP